MVAEAEETSNTPRREAALNNLRKFSAVEKFNDTGDGMAATNLCTGFSEPDIACMQVLEEALCSSPNGHW